MRGIGALRERVYIERADNDGNWTLLTPTERWARIQPLNGNEQSEAQRLQATANYQIRIRFFDGLREDDRFRDGDTRVFNIKSIRNMDERKVYMDCDCEEGWITPAGASTGGVAT